MFLPWFTAFEQLITWSDTASGSTWNTEVACGKDAVQLVQVLFSDEFVLNGKLPETPSCGIQDITGLMDNFCQGQASSDSAACNVTEDAFMAAALVTLCGAALNPSMLMRFNCGSGEFHPTCCVLKAYRDSWCIVLESVSGYLCAFVLIFSIWQAIVPSCTPFAKFLQPHR